MISIQKLLQNSENNKLENYKLENYIHDVSNLVYEYNPENKNSENPI
jgi:hypothetical protein